MQRLWPVGEKRRCMYCQLLVCWLLVPSKCDDGVLRGQRALRMLPDALRANQSSLRGLLLTQ